MYGEYLRILWSMEYAWAYFRVWTYEHVNVWTCDSVSHNHMITCFWIVTQIYTQNLWSQIIPYICFPQREGHKSNHMWSLHKSTNPQIKYVTRCIPTQNAQIPQIRFTNHIYILILIYRLTSNTISWFAFGIRISLDKKSFYTLYTKVHTFFYYLLFF